MMLHLVRVNPECPVCHSKQTGRYVYGTPDVYQIKRHLLSGERIQYIYDYHRKKYYCCSCRNEFNGNSKIQLMTRKAFHRYLADFGFIKSRNEIKAYKGLSKKEKRQIDKKILIKRLRFVATIISGVDVRDKKKEE